MLDGLDGLDERTLDEILDSKEFIEEMENATYIFTGTHKDTQADTGRFPEL